MTKKQDKSRALAILKLLARYNYSGLQVSSGFNQKNPLFFNGYSGKYIVIINEFLIGAFTVLREVYVYKAFPPAEARRIIKKPEIHYTPKHGSWLDIAEIELDVMTRQCLSRRIESIDILRRELAAWESERNNNFAKVNWQFTTKDARTKLILLYPEL